MTRPRPSLILFLSLIALFFAFPATGGVERGIVVLVQFPDVPTSIDRDVVRGRFSQQLNAYVREMSYDQVSLEVDVTSRWYRMPGPVTKYKISSRNLEVDDGRLRRLIDDALSAADAEVDYSKYDFVVIYMNASVPEYGMVGLCGYPGMLGWTSRDALKAKSGEKVPGVAIFTYQAHLGTLFHDVAHVLGGLRGNDQRMVPCLYDHDLQAMPGDMKEVFANSIINMGYWDPMSCHYYKRQAGPPGISSWTKLRLGWINGAKVKVIEKGETADFLLAPLEDGRGEVLVAKIPISKTSYYLVENRQPIGFDRNLPGSGVLIMYADDSVKECRRGEAPVRLANADPSRPHLEGAAFDFGKKSSYENAKNKVRIELKEKVGSSYRVVVTR